MSSLCDYSLYATVRVLVTFPLEHPLEMAKTRAQSDPLLTTKDILNSCKHNGIKKLYEGGISNSAIRVIRSSYRWPYVEKMHAFWSNGLPSTLKYDGVTAKLGVSLSIACLETAIVLPIERLFVSKVGELGYGHFLQTQIKVEGLRSLYQGATATFTNHSLSWTTFMLTNYALKKMSENKEKTILNKCIGSAVIGSALTAIDMPLEFICTQTQLHPKYQSISMKQVVKSLFREYGIKGFYSGAPFGVVHKTIQVFCGSYFYAKMTSSKEKSN